MKCVICEKETSSTKKHLNYTFFVCSEECDKKLITEIRIFLLLRRNK